MIGAGLCDICQHQRIVRSGRGSVFSLCRRHTEDPRFVKYPPIPVISCPGLERRTEPPPADDAGI